MFESENLFLFLMRFSSLPASVFRIAERVACRGGRAFLVGGSVRDILLEKSPKDFDVEVYGLSPEGLQKTLEEDFTVLTVGQHFSVFKLKGESVDVSLPRHESTTGPGHRDFSVRGDPELSLLEATQRRDFTINAMLWDILQGKLVDPLWKGEKDLKNRVLRPCSPSFGEDPLRVLRAMQFIARFNLEVTSETKVYSRNLSQDSLPMERIWEEWRKLILQGVAISRGLQFLKSIDWLRFYPDLAALVNCPQDPVWHPEGDVWTHTLHCLDAFAKERIGCEDEDLVVGFAVLCHDFGKPESTFTDPKGRIRSPQHEILGEAPSRRFLGLMTRQKSFIEEVMPLVLHHMRPSSLYHNKAGNGAIQRLASKVKRIDRLLRVVRADQQGRPPLKKTSFPEEKWLWEKTCAMAVCDQPPKPMVQGRDLMALGASPGRRFSLILNACWEAQMRGEIIDLKTGKHFVKTHFPDF